jgi:hypothetical protein
VTHSANLLLLETHKFLAASFHGFPVVQAGFYGTVKVADRAYAYTGISAEARTGQTLYGGSVGLRVAF